MIRTRRGYLPVLVAIAILLVVGLAIAITFRPEKTRQRADEDHMVQTAVAKTKSAADLALIKLNRT